MNGGTTKILVNGRLVDKNEAVIRIDNKAYFFDFAVYTSLKVVKGKPFFPEFHIDRLIESANLIGMKHKFTKEEMIDWIYKTINENKIDNALFRIILIGDDENRVENTYFFIIPLGLTFYPDKYYSKGVKVVTYKGERFLPQSKSKNLLLNFLAFKKARENNALDALLVDHNNNIREGTRSNVFFIKDDVLVTPPKDVVLEGITRKIVLELAKEYFEIEEREVSIDELPNFDECFITSTSMNVMPVSNIDDKITYSINKSRILNKAYKEYYHKWVLGKVTNK